MDSTLQKEDIKTDKRLLKKWDNGRVDVTIKAKEESKIA